MITLTEFKTRTVGQLAAELPNSIRVFETWKIDYCCGGRTTLPDACTATGRTVDDFVAELERAQPPCPKAPRATGARKI
jgi:regulator of cell morphogenesis and NO signaling